MKVFWSRPSPLATGFPWAPPDFVRGSWLGSFLVGLAACAGPTDPGSAAGCSEGPTGEVSCGVDALVWSDACEGPQERFASAVHAVSFGPGAGFGQEAYPEIVFGPPAGAGTLAGSLDVLTLGDGGSITVGFGGGGIADGPGADLLVFENPFWVAGDPDAPYAELGAVEVSADGHDWRAFPCSVDAPAGCAGVRPVLAGPDAPALDPLDPEEAGGDAFDLADVGLSVARFVRVTDLAGQPGRTFDLDAAAAVHPLCP